MKMYKMGNWYYDPTKNFYTKTKNEYVTDSKNSHEQSHLTISTLKKEN